MCEIYYLDINLLRILLVGYEIEFEMFWLLRKLSDRLDGAKGLIWDLKG